MATGQRESGMGAAPYHVVRERDKWTIVVAGTAQIACETRDVAINTAQRAADLLRDDRADAAACVHNEQDGSMTDSSEEAEARRMRAMAEEYRTIAENTKDLRCRQQLLGVARSYEKIAADADMVRAAAQSGRSLGN